MRTRLLIPLTLAALELMAAPAFAERDSGEGLAGETNDKIITFFSLGVVAFFVVLVIVGTVIQSALEKRKEARKAARMRGRIGW